MVVCLRLVNSAVNPDLQRRSAAKLLEESEVPS